MLPSAMPVNGPLRVSSANPRYFADSTGRIVFLTGSHTWNNLQDSGPQDPPARFDYDAFLDYLSGRGHNFFRLWTHETGKGSADTPSPYFYSPPRYRRTGPGTALDGKPKYDVNTFNDEYFARLRSRVEAAQRRGIYVSIMLFNGWSIEDKDTGGGNPWTGHPFNRANNINGIDGDANRDDEGSETHTLAIPAITALHDRYVKKVVETVNDLDNVLYEVSNESSPSSTAWQNHVITIVRAEEARLGKRHPVGMTSEWPNGNNGDLLASGADWISPNGNGLENPPAADGRKVILDDTDHLCGICGNPGWAWATFTRGRNPIFMDVYDGRYALMQTFDPHSKDFEALRRTLGYIRALAQRADLSHMRPNQDIASSGYALAFPDAEKGEYIAYVPSGGQVTIDLTATPRRLAVEWFSVTQERSVAGDSVTGGQSVTISSPFASNPATVYLRP